MATIQHYVLFESASGYSLFLVKEFDEITRKFSAHPNSFLKPLAFVPFNSLSEAVENVQFINEGRVSPLLSNFLRQNLPIKDAVLGVDDPKLGAAILDLGIGFECIWDASIRELLRIVRANSSRLLRSLVVQPGGTGDKNEIPTRSAQETVPARKAERRAQLIVAISRARLQLDLTHHLADTGVVKSLELLDSMDASLAKSMKRLLVSYGLHFPEICRGGGLPGLDDFALVSIVTYAPQRSQLLQEKDKLIRWLGGNQEMAELIIDLAKTSTGQDLSPDDTQVLQRYGQFLLNLFKSRTQCCEMLEHRVRELVPNLTSLMDQVLPGLESNSCLERVKKAGNRVSSAIVAARLLSHAVNLDRLAKMPSSRVNSLGASKSLFQRSGAIAATATGLLSRTVAHEPVHNTNKEQMGNETNSTVSSLTQNIVDSSGGRLRVSVVRRRASRLLSAKSALAARTDCYRRMNPFIDANASNLVSSPSLDSGEYGTSLGQETKRQLRVWAEANGVHLERSEEEIKLQREKRKRYRKMKRKAWLRRKMSVGSASAPLITTQGNHSVNDGDTTDKSENIAKEVCCVSEKRHTDDVPRVTPVKRARRTNDNKEPDVSGSDNVRVLRSSIRARLSVKC